MYLELDSLYLQNEASFWANVQEPSTRIKDNALLSKLAYRALQKFDNKYIRAAALVNLNYRATESHWDNVIEDHNLVRMTQYTISKLNPSASFVDCRWYLSICLALAALHLSRDDKNEAYLALQQSDLFFHTAHSYGQVFTNITKSVLLRLIIVSDFPPYSNERCLAKKLAEQILFYSNNLAQYYKFSNEYAFEEVSYVYSILREIFNWNILFKDEISTLHSLQAEGFRWHRIGGPFNTFFI